MRGIGSIVLMFCFCLITLNLQAKVYYVNPIKGNNNYDGLSESKPFKTLWKVNQLKLKAGDEIRLAKGYTHKGSLQFEGVSGTVEKPIVISSYAESKKQEEKEALINAYGLRNGILISNCSNIKVSDLSIIANGGVIKGKPVQKDMRCGILVKATKAGVFQNIHFSGIKISDIYYEEPGFQRGAKEVRTANGTQKYGWGMRFISNVEKGVLRNIEVTGCEISDVAHTGIKFTGIKRNIKNVKVLGNKVLRAGGPGIQLSNVQEGQFVNNMVDKSGDSNDSRKWGRGSGLWTWGAKNIVIENNKFLNANGPGDSAGCHIDFNCANVIVQYNFSYNNAGGFCEILGNNHNCAYRYNISVNDGYREKGKNGAFQHGKVFWLSGYVGKKKPRKGPYNSYFYNNTIFTSKENIARLAVESKARGILIANNIFHVSGKSELVLGDQYNPQKAVKVKPKNVVFENNLYLNESTWPKNVNIQDEKPVYGDAKLAKAGGLSLSDYIPANVSLIKDKGIKIEPIPNDSIGIYIGLDMKEDILGNKINGLPDMGAIELE
ncbi:right-handed parallel beta-helix repeat-containing protein [Labilibacter sediminis]|nr:right-handed parallel beta-helix repeat-containing protein [Labilibacter sediminis]